MTIDEALHRVVRGHWVMILLAVLLPVLVAAGIGMAAPSLYEAATRVQLGSDLAASNVQADASSERALGIATSPGVVRRALDEAGLSKDPAAFARDHVDVRRVGVSPVIEIAVTDTSPKRAAVMATSITTDVLEFSNASDRRSASSKLAALRKSIAGLTKTRNALIPRLQTATPGAVLTIQAQLTALQATLTEYERQSSELELAAAARSSAVLLDAARRPTVPLPSDTSQRAVLAGLLGLLVGLGLAAGRETIWPTLHSPRAISYAVDAPMIAKILTEDATSPAGVAALGLIADRIALLGRRHETAKVLLVPVRAMDDEWANAVARRLSPQREKATAHRLECAVMDARWVDPGEHPAAVVLTPSRIRAREIQPVQELLASVGWPVLGVLAYDPAGRLKRRARASRPEVGAGPGPEPERETKPELAGKSEPTRVSKTKPETKAARQAAESARTA